MRAAAIAVAVFAAFVGVMYLRFSGDAVPEPQPRPSAGANVAGNCFIARLVGAPEPTPTSPDAGPTHVPCSTVSPFDPFAGFNTVPPTPPSDPVPGLLKDVAVYELENGSEITMPEDLALIIETGCFQCDGPTTGLSRVYRDPAGAIRVDTLVSAEKLGLPPRLITTAKGTEEWPPDLTAFVVAPDGSELIVAFYTRGFCGGDGAPSADGETTIYRSTNGGIAWSEFGRLPPGHFMRRGFLGNGRVVVGSYTNETETSYVFPSGEELRPPPDTSPYVWPRPLSNGDVLWQTGQGRVLREDGTLLVDAGGPYGSAAGDLVPDPRRAGSILASLSSKTGNYLAIRAPDGRVEGAYHFPNFLLLGAWPQERWLFGNATVDPSRLGGPPPSPFFVNYLPAVIDLDTRTVHPIREPFLDPPLTNGRNHIVAVQQGPFARVVNTEGTCLNIREATTPGAAVLECAAEGVLLTRELTVTGYEGTVWEAVRTPSGIRGWASQAYLEY